MYASSRLEKLKVSSEKYSTSIALYGFYYVEYWTYRIIVILFAYKPPHIFLIVFEQGIFQHETTLCQHLSIYCQINSSGKKEQVM